MSGKYVKRGVKRQHGIIPGILPLLERISAVEGVKKVVPAEISYSPRRKARRPSITLQRETSTGFRLLARSGSSLQVIYVVARGPREEVRRSLEGLCIQKTY
jgi:hypothetical protein